MGCGSSHPHSVQQVHPRPHGAGAGDDAVVDAAPDVGRSPAQKRQQEKEDELDSLVPRRRPPLPDPGVFSTVPHPKYEGFEAFEKRIQGKDTLDFSQRGKRPALPHHRTHLPVPTGTETSLGRLSPGRREIAHKLDILLRDNTTLTSLSLAVNKLGDAGVVVLADLLRGNKMLRTLNLSVNRIGNEGVNALAEVLCDNDSLTELDLSGNMFGDQGVGGMCSMLEANSRLLRLDLSGTRLGDEGVSNISLALPTNEALEHLGLRFLKLTDTGGTALVDGVKSSRTLTSVSVLGNTALTPGVKEDLDEALKCVKDAIRGRREAEIKSEKERQIQMAQEARRAGKAEREKARWKKRGLRRARDQLGDVFSAEADLRLGEAAAGWKEAGSVPQEEGDDTAADGGPRASAPEPQAPEAPAPQPLPAGEEMAPSGGEGSSLKAPSGDDSEALARKERRLARRAARKKELQARKAAAEAAEQAPPEAPAEEPTKALESATEPAASVDEAPREAVAEEPAKAPESAAVPVDDASREAVAEPTSEQPVKEAPEAAAEPSVEASREAVAEAPPGGGLVEPPEVAFEPFDRSGLTRDAMRLVKEHVDAHGNLELTAESLASQIKDFMGQESAESGGGSVAAPAAEASAEGGGEVAETKEAKKARVRAERKKQAQLRREALLKKAAENTGDA